MSLNRTQQVQAILWLDQLATHAKAEGAKLRAELADAARAEFEEQGTAPTWRIPDVATVAAAVTHRSASVGVEHVFLDWVQNRYPTEIEQVRRVRPAWQAVLLASVAFDRIEPSGRPCAIDPATGEIVPGVVVTEGGQFSGVSIRATGAAKEVFGALAAHGLRKLALEAGPAVPVVLAEVET